jgi:hypothetical protein
VPNWLPPKPALKTAIVVVRVAPALTGIQVGTDMPNPRPAQFVQMSRIGGSRNIKQDYARLLVECWSTSQGGCETLSANVSAALLNASGTTVGGTFIYGWDDQQGPVDYPDDDITDKTSPSSNRWQLHGDFIVSV